MNFDVKGITGKIIINSEVIGTGFLVTNDLFITAKHNVHQNRSGKPSEKKITIIFAGKEIKGETLNLIEAYNERIDIVFIKLDEPIYDLDFTKVIKSCNSFKNYEFKSYGYPKEKLEGYYLEGSVLSDDKIDDSMDISLNMKEEYFLSSYQGLSGSPICVNDFIVGIIIAQETEKNLFGISFDLVEKKLKDLSYEIFPLEKKELRNISFKNIEQINKELDNNFFHNHINEAFKIAGPRYSQDINIKNSAFENLQIFSGQYDFLKNLKEKIKGLSSCLKRLKDSDKSESTPFCEESYNEIIEISKDFEVVLNELKNLAMTKVLEEKIDFFEQLDDKLSELSEKLQLVFNLELKRFEEKYGEGKFEDKSWRGYMSSYLCTFPAANLDNVKELVTLTNELKAYFSNKSLKLYFSKTLLLKGRGGIGKTHSLCDIVNYNIKNDLPSLIFFGQYFRDKSPEEVILEKLSLSNADFESLLYQLDNIGYRINKNILMCIDAINETNDKTYWNNYLISFTEKIKKYRYIKLVISCRSLYLDEVLDEDISKRYLIIEHKGFEEVESEAIAEYFKYYGLNIPYADKMQKEFANPLFLKLYCEVLAETKIDNFDYNIDDLSSLFENFFKVKNKKISNKFSDYLSPKDNIVSECTVRISNTMKEKNLNYLEWSEIKEIIQNFLTKEIKEDKLNPKLILDELISENILKEDIIEMGTLSFAFERFFDYLIAKNVIDLEKLSKLKDNINNFKNNLFVYKGTLEILMILYKEKYNEELIKKYDIKDTIFYELFLSSLSWRKNINIDIDTKKIFEYCLTESKDKNLVEMSLFVLYELSLKENCLLNAEYFHHLFKHQRIYIRDGFLGYWMLKSYEKHTIINKIINNSIYLKENNIEYNIIKLWLIILVWFISLNDINIRDRASKGLTNLLKLYPEATFYIIEEFKYTNDDYIQERLWGAIYASLILNRDESQIKDIINYIFCEYIEKQNFPENVLLRDLLRNIAELAKTLNMLEHDITLFRPPYRSEKIEKLNISYDEVQEKYKKLFRNCTDSDFGVYTIPSEVQNYGFSRKEVGILVYNEIVSHYYSDQISNLDDHIDFTYGSLRNRDESIERVGKKYQNINLKKILGRIYDNYPYTSDWEFNNEEEYSTPPEQGNEFREIDLTSLPYEELDYDFSGNSIEYDFRKLSRLSYKEWFIREDIAEIAITLIENLYCDEEYLLLGGLLKSKKINIGLEDYPKQNLWFQIRSYLVKNEDVSIFNEWVKDQHFWGQWMPTGYEQLSEGWIGEYPWSPTYVNILEDIDDNQKTPVNLIPTVNNFINERDSKFCQPKIGAHFRFPSEIFFKKLKLEWNGQNVYFNNAKPFFIIGSGENNAIYVNKKLLNQFLEENRYAIVWTVLGEKQVIEGEFSGKFIGSAEFSQTFKYDKNVLPNHYYYKAIDENFNILIENIKKF